MKKVLLAVCGCAALLCGCATTKKLVQVDTPVGYSCKVHGEHEKSYKVGVKYYCTVCVDSNLDKVELVLAAVPTTTTTTSTTSTTQPE